MVKEQYSKVYQQWHNDPAGFWLKAAQKIHWYKSPETAYDNDNRQKQGLSKWFLGAQCNTCYNCVDIHVENHFGNRKAIIYDSPVTNTIEHITYAELQRELSEMGAILQHFEVRKGDRVIIYMPMIPQTVVAMLACARIGAVHSVVFGGFVARELASRIDDAKPKIIISASAGIEPKRVIAYKPMLDEAIEMAHHKPKSCIIYQRKELKAQLKPKRDYDWQELQKHARENQWTSQCEVMQASDPLYILYTSGTTGTPKGIVRDNGGHMVALRWSMENIYDVKPAEVFWSASDIGWVVGHSYIVYAPLLNGSTTVIYEGKPVDTPDAGAFWRVIEQHNVVSLFTAPTAFRAIKREDKDSNYLKKYNLKTLRSLFLAGERADPETIRWAENALKIPVIDHWWQTETGWAIAANPMGIELLKVKHGSAGLPMPGYDIKILGDDAKQKKAGEIGNICVKLPMPPGCLNTIWKNHRQYQQKYEKSFEGYYDTADAGYIDEKGLIYIMARRDDIINVAGHRLSTGAIEEVIAEHSEVSECAVVGMADKIKGQLPIGFVVLNVSVEKPQQHIVEDIIAKVRKELGAIAAFKNAIIVKRLPKTRSGKILRNTLRKIIDGEKWQMPPTIDDPDILYEIIGKIKKSKSI